MDFDAARRAHIPVMLGSDVAGGPDRSMVRVARAMIETARRLGHAPPSAADAFHAITRAPADALAWLDAGRLEPGAAADLVVIEPDIPWHTAPDPLACLLYAWDDRWITQTICRGVIAYQR
jgi:cytosine/adenosine deaminase-related metal-dependent hydrolase